MNKTSVKLHALGFLCQLATIYLAQLAAGINSNWYFLPIFAGSFLFAYLFYKNEMPHMWFYMLTYVVAFAIYLGINYIIASPTAPVETAVPFYMELILVFSSACIPVFPVSMAYWIYMRRAAKVRGGK